MEKQQLKKAAELLQDRLSPIIGDIRKSEDGGNTKIEGTVAEKGLMEITIRDYNQMAIISMIFTLDHLSDGEIEELGEKIVRPIEGFSSVARDGTLSLQGTVSGRKREGAECEKEFADEIAEMVERADSFREEYLSQEDIDRINYENMTKTSAMPENNGISEKSMEAIRGAMASASGMFDSEADEDEQNADESDSAENVRPDEDCRPSETHEEPAHADVHDDTPVLSEPDRSKETGKTAEPKNDEAHEAHEEDRDSRNSGNESMTAAEQPEINIPDLFGEVMSRLEALEQLASKIKSGENAVPDAPEEENAAEACQAENHEEQTALNDEIQSLKKENQALQEKNEDLLKVLGDAQKMNEALDERIASLENTLMAEKEANVKMSDENAAARQERKSAIAEAQMAKAKVKELRRPEPEDIISELDRKGADAHLETLGGRDIIVGETREGIEFTIDPESGIAGFENTCRNPGKYRKAIEEIVKNDMTVSITTLRKGFIIRKWSSDPIEALEDAIRIIEEL